MDEDTADAYPDYERPEEGEEARKRPRRGTRGGRGRHSSPANARYVDPDQPDSVVNEGPKGDDWYDARYSEDRRPEPANFRGSGRGRGRGRDRRSRSPEPRPLRRWHDEGGRMEGAGPIGSFSRPMSPSGPRAGPSSDGSRRGDFRSPSPPGWRDRPYNDRPPLDRPPLRSWGEFERRRDGRTPPRRRSRSPPRRSRSPPYGRRSPGPNYGRRSPPPYGRRSPPPLRARSPPYGRPRSPIPRARSPPRRPRSPPPRSPLPTRIPRSPPPRRVDSPRRRSPSPSFGRQYSPPPLRDVPPPRRPRSPSPPPSRRRSPSPRPRSTRDTSPAPSSTGGGRDTPNVHIPTGPRRSAFGTGAFASGPFAPSNRPHVPSAIAARQEYAAAAAAAEAAAAAAASKKEDYVSPTLSKSGNASYVGSSSSRRGKLPPPLVPHLADEIAANKAHRLGVLYRDDLARTHALRRALAELARAEADSLSASEATKVAEAQLERFGGSLSAGVLVGAWGAA